ncbi:MAG: ABC transporter permease [Acidobacteriota bacterium]
MGTTWQDIRFSVRVLKKNPWVSAVAVLALALGIGGNTVIFSVVNGILLQPLPFSQPQQLVQVMRSLPQFSSPWVSVPHFFHWRDNSQAFSSLAAYDNLGSGFNLSGSSGRPERLIGSKVTAGFFTVFAAPPALGRGFVPQDDQPGAPPVVILSHALWQGRLGGDPALIGQALTLNDRPYTVVGVAPEGFRYPSQAELWTPLQLDPSDQSPANYLYVTARLKPGASLQEARSEMTLLGEQFLDAHPGWADAGDEAVALRPLQEFLYGNLRPALLVMLAAVGLVLLIACANVANLQLARSANRSKEIAIRTALGAKAGRIFRQLLSESLLLALIGGVLGIVLCAVSLRPLLTLSPMPLPRLADVGLDWSVLLFTLALSLLTGILFGLAPALQASKVDLNDSLQESSLRSTAGAAGKRIRLALVTGEIALAVVLMISASLLLRSFMAIRDVDPGFDASGVLIFKLGLSGDQYPQGEALERLTSQLLPRIEGLPGVQNAAAAMPLVLELSSDLPFTIEGRYQAGTQIGVGSAYYTPVAGSYFQALRIPLLRGRRFSETDRPGSELTAIINQAAARRYWPEEEALGQRIHLGMPAVADLADPHPRRIVGIVQDVRQDGLDQPPPPIVYVPLGQISDGLAGLLVPFFPLSLAVRSETPSGWLAQAVQQQVWSIDPNQPVSQIRSLEEIVAATLGAREFNMILLGMLAAMALLLAAMGIYGVLSYLVGQRRREIGIRMALGAGRGQILRMVVFQWMKAALAGIGLGLAGALAATRLLSRMISGVSPTDLMTFLAVPVLFTLVALAAIYFPARRATLVDPTRALRWE